MVDVPKSSTREFVNPYTFVTFAEHDPMRAIPPGHRRSPAAPADGGEGAERVQPATLYSGTIDVTWEVQTPLLLPARAREEGWVTGGSSASGEQCDIRLPGSAIKGAVRSLHETMFNGCLRVFDDEYSPVYRDSMKPGLTSSWRMAVVVESKNGTPQRVALCDRAPLWIDSLSLLAAYRRNADRPESPRSGDVLDLSDPGEEDPFGRRILRNVNNLDGVERPSVERWGDQDRPAGLVLLVTDTAARTPTRKDREGRRRRARAYWAASEITTTTVPVTTQAANHFAITCDGARDMSSKELAKHARGGVDYRAANCFAPVQWWRTIEGGGTTPSANDWVDVAERMRATGFLHPGAVVWVQLTPDGGSVAGIKLAVAWRTIVENDQSIVKRYPNGYRGCEDKDTKGLCLSCATFGMVHETKSSNGRKGDVFAYAGHVRFGDASGQASTREITCAPQGQPRPSSAGMYLTSKAKAPPGRARDDKRSQWGVKEDHPVPRLIAGRKFYWHGDPDAQVKFWASQMPRGADPVLRYEARGHHKLPQDGGMTGEAREVVPMGTVLKQRITVEDVDLATLVALCTALAPGEALVPFACDSKSEFCVHLGGGKGLGLGTVRPKITGVSVLSSKLRYTGGQAVSPDLSFSKNQKLVEKRCGSVEVNLRLLAAVLDRHFLGDDQYLLWYPPKGEWSELGKKGFDESFEFFAQYSGERLKDRERDFFALPALPDVVDGTSPRLPNAK